MTDCTFAVRTLAGIRDISTREEVPFVGFCMAESRKPRGDLFKQNRTDREKTGAFILHVELYGKVIYRRTLRL